MPCRKAVLQAWQHVLERVLMNECLPNRFFPAVICAVFESPIDALIGLHVTAIGFYALRGKPLWRAMLSGRARREHAQQADARGGRWPVALLALLLAVAVVWAVERLPAHFMPAPAAPAPALAW